jgi:two-component system, NarL family, response regulator NreC
MTDKIRVVIADDHDLYRRGLVDFLKTEGIVVLSEAADAIQLLKQVDQFNPDVVITDLIMPGDGVKAIKEMRKNGITRTIALSSFESEGLMLQAKEAGTLGFIHKNTDNADIIDAINTVYRYKEYYCKSITIKMALRLAKINNNKPTRLILPSFSAEEVDIIRMVCEGKLSKDIAKEMYMGKRTVDRMREKIIQKMGVKTPPEMAIYAVKYSIYIIPRDDFE